MKTNILNLIAYILVIIGGLNWACIAAFQLDLVALVFGSSAMAGSRIVYGLVGLSAIWLIIAACINRGRIVIDTTDESM